MILTLHFILQFVFYPFHKMNDIPTFTNFLTNVAGVIVPRARNELLMFANTFRALLSSSEDELDRFVKDTHAANSARAANARILIPTQALIMLKAVLFELKDCERCDALPNDAMLQALDAIQVNELRSRRNQVKQDESNKSTEIEVTVPKLTAMNYQDFVTALEALASNITGACGATLDYLMRDTNGNYEDAWTSRAVRLKHCARLHGPHFSEDSKKLYSLFFTHVRTTGVGSDIVNRHADSKDGYTCFHEFNNHYKNESYLDNIATVATNTLDNASYKGDRPHFTIETYYSIISNAFNDLGKAGAAHHLTEQHKITKFEKGLVDKTAVTWAITAKSERNNLPPHRQTFDGYYNCFSKYINKFRAMTNNTSSRNTRIFSMNSRGRGRGRFGRGGRGRGRGGRGRGRGRGYGRGRHGHRFNPYSIAAPVGDYFRAEAKVYTSDEWSGLNVHQRQQIQDLKVADGWVNGSTPPPGCVLDQHGYATASTSLVAAVRRTMAFTDNATIAAAYSAPPLPPPPTHGMVPPPPPVPFINTNASQTGSSFGRQGTRIAPSSDSTQISNVSAVTINGQTYNGPVFDRNNNRIA